MGGGDAVIIRETIQQVVARTWMMPFKWKIICGCGIAAIAWFWFSLPSNLFNAPTSYVITDKNGVLLNASIASDGQWRFPYNKNVPEKFKHCITAFEDKRFYYHMGVDPVAMGRAVYQNVDQQRVVSGGSTLTMQVIRLGKKNASRNIWNKVSESLLAVRMELTYSKQEIMALYAANAPFGSNVVGLDAAAWRYYGRSAEQLTWGETAALAVLPNAPALVHPGKNRDALLRKRNDLLSKLAANKTISESTADLAKLEPLPAEPKRLPQLAPHLADRFTRDLAVQSKSTERISTGIQTTLDAQLQQQVGQVVERHHQQLKGNHIRNAAAIVVEIETGNILAYVGNIYKPQEPETESHVDVLSSVRSPGSTLKPLLYASLLSEGLMLPKQLIPDIPTQLAGFTPENFDLGYDGAVPAHRALARSLNIPAVKMLQQYKYQRFYDQLKQMGITSLTRPADDYGMSLVLGGCEISPFELAGVYASMARMYLHQEENKGEWNAADWFMPRYQVVEKGMRIGKSQSITLFDYTALWHTFNAMTEVARPGEEGLWGLFNSAQRIGWKTGTSFGFRDGWAIGITPKYCVLTWAGNTTGEGRPGLTGINTAAPILFDIFRLLPATEWFEPPVKNITYIDVCNASGFKAGPECKGSSKVLVSPRSKTNATLCPYHRVIHLDPSASYRVTSRCQAPASMQHVSWFVLPPTIEYYYRQRHADYQPLPPFMSGCEATKERRLEIIYPDADSRIYVPLELSGGRGKTVFSATHRNAEAKLFWHLDNDFVGSTQKFHQLALSPPPGQHLLTVVDEDGESVSRQFEILEKEKN
ncbi:MAG: pbpC [Chitinophagaceae bacterium]|nr:pbpC [Chitinophagaceae bacterium]